MILIPFRDPMQQAYSLLRQHLRFVELQSKDGFVQSYMTWLGHHEFGHDHKPFLFDKANKRDYPITQLEYWIELWLETYQWLEYSIPDSAVFVCYEDLCVDNMTWSKLVHLAEITMKEKISEPFKLSSHYIDSGVDRELANNTARLYSRLVERSRIQLSTKN